MEMPPLEERGDGQEAVATELRTTRRVGLLLPNLKMGGAERQALVLAENLPAFGWEAVILCSQRRGELLERAGKSGIRVHDLGQKFWLRKWTREFAGNFRASLRRLDDICREEHIVILQGYFFWQNLMAIAAKMRCRTVRGVVSGRRNEGDYTWLPWRYLRFQDLLSPWVDAVVGNSERLGREIARREYVSRRKIHVIPNGIDVAHFADGQSGGVRDAHPVLENADPLIGTLGNLRAEKRHDLFLETLARVRRRHPHAKGVIIGADFGQLAALESLRDRLGLSDAVVFASGVSDPAPWLKALDVFLLTSDVEGMPNALMEAMAAGRACVTTDVSGAADLIRGGVTGLIVARGDVEAMAEAVGSLAGDPAARNRMGDAAARHMAENHTAAVMAGRFAALYDRLTGGMGARGTSKETSD